MHKEVSEFFNMMAEGWDSKEEKNYEWLSRFINDYVPISKGMKVLDLGCGTGIISSIIWKMTKTKVIALDISEKMIEIANIKHSDKDIDFYSEDFYKTSRKGFDMILCYNAYPHFTDIHNFKEKSKEILNDNGQIVILHSLSREELRQCHKGLSENISRGLESVEQEVKMYLDDFDILDMIDNERMFMIRMKKKN